MTADTEEIVPPSGPLLAISERSLRVLFEMALAADAEQLRGSCWDQTLPVDSDTGHPYCAECWAMEEAQAVLDSGEAPSGTEEIVKRLLGGPEGNGWSCDFASEVDLISEAALEIGGLSREVDRLRERVDRLEWALMHPTTADAEALRSGLLEASLFGSPVEETP